MPRAYFIEFGRARHVGRFAATEFAPRPGEVVVVRSARGHELGTVLVEAADSAAAPIGDRAQVVRIAGADDFARLHALEARRHETFESCRELSELAGWPIDPIDVEPLLDEGRAILSYLGPHRVDVAPLRAAFLKTAGIELVFEPAGSDAAEIEPEAAESGSCGSCGSSGGGCGSGGGCTGCEVKALVARRRAKQPVA